MSGVPPRRSEQKPFQTDRSSLGWNAIEVTKSRCWKAHRHSDRETCHRRTVLSIEDERRKLF